MTTPHITIYSNVGCQPCRLTKMWLDKRGIKHDYIVLKEGSADEAAVNAIFESDPSLARQAPVVVVGGEGGEPSMIWTGLNDDFLAKYCTPEAAA